MGRRTGSRAVAALIAACMAPLAIVASACAAYSIGQSAEGRPLPVIEIGEGPRAVLLIGGLHTGAEDNSRVIAEQIAAHLALHPELVPASVTVYVLPSANPDGSARGIHTNARGVDLNRNWPAGDWIADACHPSTGCRPGHGGPAPLSEPETAALYAFIEELRPEVTVVWHAEAPLVEANEVVGADGYGRAFADVAGYPYVEEWTAYRITGQLIDALEQRLGLRAFDVELSECCAISGVEFERNLRGVTAVLTAVDARPEPTPTRTPKPKVTPTQSRGLGLHFPTAVPTPAP